MVSKTKGVLKLKYLFRLIYKSSGTDDLDALSALKKKALEEINVMNKNVFKSTFK